MLFHFRMKFRTDSFLDLLTTPKIDYVFFSNWLSVVMSSSPVPKFLFFGAVWFSVLFFPCIVFLHNSSRIDPFLSIFTSSTQISVLTFITSFVLSSVSLLSLCDSISLVSGHVGSLISKFPSCFPSLISPKTLLKCCLHHDNIVRPLCILLL